MVREHHRLNGHEFEPSLGNSEGQGSLQSMASQTVRHNLVTEQQQSLMFPPVLFFFFSSSLNHQQTNILAQIIPTHTYIPTPSMNMYGICHP